MQLVHTEELDEDTLTRQRRVLGEDHPKTQRSARNLTADLRALDRDSRVHLGPAMTR